MKKRKHYNVFGGERAISDYLTPDKNNFAPLVELPKKLNPYYKDGVRLYIKLMQTVPLVNIKAVPSWYMLDSIPKEKLAKIKHLVEYSSGNTVMSLAVLSKHFGIPNMHAIITPDVPEHKQKLLKLLGVDLIISDGPPSPDVFAKIGGIWDAKQMGKKSGWHNLNQYENISSPKASYEIVGRELWKQLNGEVDILCASLGTGGTVFGSAKFLKNKNPNLYVVATSIKRGHSIPGPRGEDAVKKLSFPWEKLVDIEVPVEALPAYKHSHSLIKEGLFVGPSTGMQLAGLLKEIGKLKKNKKLSKYKKDGKINAVFVACDTMFPYISEYFDMLKIK